MIEFATSVEGRDAAGLTSNLFNTATVASVVTTPTPPYGTRSIQVQSASDLAKTGLANASTRVIAALVRFASTANGAGLAWIGLGDGDPNVSASTQISLVNDSTGHIEVYRGRGVGLNTGGTLIGSASSQSFAADQWYYVELRVVFDNSAGVVQVRVNNTTWINITGVDTTNTANAYSNSFALGAVNSGFVTYWKSIICIGNTGSAPTDWIGEVIIDGTVVNTGNGANADSTPSTGTDRGANVNEVPPNSDTDYNTLVGVGDLDTYGVTLAVPSGSTVYGVQVSNFVKKTDAAACEARSVVRTAGTDYFGTSAAVGTAYGYNSHFWNVSPATAAAWTPANVNAVEVGVERSV